jgi:hypothetical protein
VQQNVAQTRQVRKEATVGKEFCVTQGRLTSLYLLQQGEVIALEREACFAASSARPNRVIKGEAQ